MKRTEDVCIETLKNRMTNKNEKKSLLQIVFSTHLLADSKYT